MPLNWNVSQTEWHNLPEKEKEASWSAAQTVILSTMAVGIGTITDKNAGEFYARLKLIYVSDELGMPESITPDFIRSMIGLRTNVFPQETRTQWLRRVGGDVLNSYVREFGG